MLHVMNLASSNTLIQLLEATAGVREIWIPEDDFLLSYSKQPPKIYNLADISCRIAGIHYENMPIQIYRILYLQKQKKIQIFFIFLLKT